MPHPTIPLLEYCVQVWPPYKQKYIYLINCVQRMPTRLVPSMRKLSYEKRLETLMLTKLIDRRFRLDMIETYMVLTGKEDIYPSRFFQMERERGDPELGQGLKLFKERAYGMKRKK